MNPTTQQPCYHCGDLCVDTKVVYDDHSFCCEGCKAVYQILRGSELTDYYELQDQAKIKADTFRSIDQFAYLDRPDMFEKLLDFHEAGLAKISLDLPQIHCSACLWLLERLPSIHQGIRNSRVDFLSKRAYITFSPDLIKLSELLSLLSRIGYEPDLRLQDIKEKESTGMDKSLYTRIGVAGFCFGNIMLLSFPEYLSSESITPAFQLLFSYINLLLSLPVLIYSSSVFYLSAFRGIKYGVFNVDVPITLGIITLFSWSVWQTLSQSGVAYFDSLAALVFFLLLGRWFQQKTYHRLHFEHDFSAYFPLSATRIKNKKEQVVAISSLKVDDVLLIRHGELLPADAQLLSEQAHIDYSFVSGESTPIPKQAGDQLYAGGRQIGAAIRILLNKEASQSYLTQLWQQEVFQSGNRPQLSTVVDKMSKYFTFSIITIAIIAGIYWYSIAPHRVIEIMAAVLIVACPCGLALTIPVTLGNALRILAKQGFYVRNTQTIESLDKLSQIVFDKTGTLTYKNYEPDQQIHYELKTAQPELIVALAHQSSHPKSRLIQQIVSQTDYLPIEDYREIPGQGIEATVKGHNLKIGSYDFSLGKQSTQAAIPAATYFSIDGQPAGYLVNQDVFRKGSKELLSRLIDNYQLVLLSGDHPDKKEAILPFVPNGTQVLLGKSPQEKLTYIQSLQQKGQQVMMIGDGLNDAGALKQSDVGVAITDSLESFSPACDAILSSDSLVSLDQFLGFGRSSLTLVRVGMIISLLYNIVGIALAVQGLISPLVVAILMPLSSISIVLFGLGATNFLAKMMGLEAN